MTHIEYYIKDAGVRFGDMAGGDTFLYKGKAYMKFYDFQDVEYAIPLDCLGTFEDAVKLVSFEIVEPVDLYIEVRKD